MTDLSLRSLREEPPSAARTASGGSPSSTPDELDDGSGIIPREPGQGATPVLPGLPSSSPPVTPHPPGGLQPFACDNCRLEFTEPYCDCCGKQLPLRSWATARATHAGGEAPQTLPPPPDPDAQHPSTGRTTP